MIEANLIRRLPSLPVAYFSQDDLPPIPNPTWPHLAIIYQILTKLLSLRPLAPHHLRFAAKLLAVSGSPDPQERAAMITFYQQFARSAPACRHKLLFLVAGRMRDAISDPLGGLLLLITLFPLIQSLLTQVNLDPSDEERIFLTVVLPSMAHALYPLFAVLVDPVLEFFLENGARPSVELAKFLIAKWPSLCPVKQVLFFERLMSSLAHVCANGAEALIPRMGRLIRGIAAAPHEKVALAVASVWREAPGLQLLATWPRLLIPLFGPLMHELAHKHWSIAVRQSAQTALIAFRRTDARGVQRALEPPEDLGFKAQYGRWMDLAKVAHRADPSVVLKDALGTISKLFPYRSSGRSESQDKIGRRSSSGQKAHLIRPKLMLKD
jgi:hypothetical protein